MHNITVTFMKLITYFINKMQSCYADKKKLMNMHRRNQANQELYVCSPSRSSAVSSIEAAESSFLKTSSPFDPAGTRISPNLLAYKRRKRVDFHGGSFSLAALPPQPPPRPPLLYLCDIC